MATIWSMICDILIHAFMWIILAMAIVTVIRNFELK